jgi:hypothetical protein
MPKSWQWRSAVGFHRHTPQHLIPVVSVTGTGCAYLKQSIDPSHQHGDRSVEQSAKMQTLTNAGERL